MDQKRNHILGFEAAFLVLTDLDQWTKKLAVTHLMGKRPYVIWNGVFELFYSENRGAAFGMLQGKQALFLIITLCVFSAILYALIRLSAGRRFLPMELCLTVIAAGAAGNMIDRVSQVYVVDFLYFKLIDFPIFNVADCYVTVATVVLMALFLWFYKEEEVEILFPGRKGQA